jgi:nucleoside-diphosphate-sugar epimerase
MIAVTGANGLLGSFILRKLIEQRIPVTGIIRDTSDMSLVKDIAGDVAWKKADVTDPVALMENLRGASAVIHAAAMVSFNPRATRKIFKVNTEGTKNVVDACLALGIPRLIHISSVAALGRDKETLHITEENKWIESDLNSDYAKSKHLAELEVYRGHEEGLSISVINPSVIFAPADWNKSSAQIFKYVWDEKPFYINNPINFVDVRDVANLVWLTYGHPARGERFIANGGTISLQKVLYTIAGLFEKKAPGIEVSASILPLLSRLEEIRCLLMNKEPFITSQTIKAAKFNFEYSSQKAINAFNIKFHTIEDTLEWCCASYRQTFSTNK